MRTYIQQPVGLLPSLNRILMHFSDTEDDFLFVKVEDLEYGEMSIIQKLVRNNQEEFLFDLSELTDSQLEFISPNPESVSIQFLPFHLKYFKLQESTDGVTYTDVVEWSAIKSKIQFANINQQYSSSLFAALTSRTVSETANYFVTVAGYPNDPVEFKIIYDDGTTHTETQLLPSPTYNDVVFSAIKQRAYLVPVGFPQQGYADKQPGKVISRVVITFNNETLTLYPSSKKSIYEVELLYWDRYSGNFETLIAKGQSSSESEFQRNDYSIYGPSYSTTLVDNGMVQKVEEKMMMKLRTGYFKSKSEFQSALNIMSAERVLAKLSDKYVEVAITDKKIKGPQDGDTLYSFEFSIDIPNR
ncbi:hypothetical protein V6R21_32230 [Limibacter armeniacum]|uniref:hypothetical protein n=1 Tax=Limibacter armeniacum TaxID=466084 RepID=UPI002FE5DCA4